MKNEKRNTNLNYPIKLNYKSNKSFYSYRGGKSTTDLKIINVNKKHLLEENKSFISYDKKSKNQSCLFTQKTIKNKNNLNEILSPLNYHSNKNIHFKSDNNTIKIIKNNNSYYYSYKNKNNNSYCSDHYRKVSSKYNINNLLSNNNHNYSIFNNYNYSYLNTLYNNKKSLLNKKNIYQKPKNERTIPSYSFIISDYYSNNKENINQNIKSNFNTESNYNNYIYNNMKQFQKCNNSINSRFTEYSNETSFIGNNKGNYIFYSDKNNQRFFAERIKNIDYSKLNLYSPKEYKNDHLNFGANYLKKSRDKVKTDIINNDISDTLSFFSENNYKTFNDNKRNHSYIYVRKNSSKKLLMKNINNSFKSTNNEKKYKKIRVNLKPNNIFENALFVQKNVILIQKNYRMHLACLKKYILKAIKNIIEGTNKLYYIFYRYYFTKMVYILNNAYIRSIDINMKTAKIIPKFSNKATSHEKSKKNELIKPTHYYVIMNNPEKKKKLDIKNNKKINFIYSPKSKIIKKTKFQNSNLNKIQKEIVIIRNLKSKLINKMNNYKT